MLFSHNQLQYQVPFCPVFLLCLPSLCRKSVDCLILFFRKGFIESLIWFWWIFVVDSLIMGDFVFLIIFSLYKKIVYVQFACTSSNWCTHAVPFLCVQFICLWWGHSAFSQRTCNARDNWDLLQIVRSFYGYLERSASAVYVLWSTFSCIYQYKM